MICMLDISQWKRGCVHGVDFQGDVMGSVAVGRGKLPSCLLSATFTSVRSRFSVGIAHNEWPVCGVFTPGAAITCFDKYVPKLDTRGCGATSWGRGITKNINFHILVQEATVRIGRTIDIRY